MPVSEMTNVPYIMAEVDRLKPQTVLDLGIGFGKYGVLCREVLDAKYGHCKKDEWRAEIHGVETFGKYENPVWGVYDYIWLEDYSSYCQSYKNYDLVLMIDSLEHLEPTTGRVVLQTLVENNKNVIVSVPLGPCPQGAEFGNEHECHRATFNGPEDFAQYKYRQLYKGVCLVLSINGTK